MNSKKQYDLEEHLIYGRQKGWKKVLEWILTILAWGVLFAYVAYLIYGMIALRKGWYLPEFGFFTAEMVFEIEKYFFYLFVATLIICVLLIIWKNYNLHRFGKLRRRKFRSDVSDEEIAELFEMDLATVKDMQSRRVVVLEKNVIPPELGMGRKKKEKEEE